MPMCMNFKVAALVAFAVPAMLGGGSEVPFSAIRLRKPQTDSPAVWKATLEQFRKHRAGVDDVWFSTGICFPDMAEHRANAVRLANAAEELRAIGIKPSLQIQATIGHGDAIVEIPYVGCWNGGYLVFMKTKEVNR